MQAGDGDAAAAGGAGEGSGDPPLIVAAQHGRAADVAEALARGDAVDELTSWAVGNLN